MAHQYVKFTKMQGAGNDYIYVNTLLYDIPRPEAAAVKWSDRHKGIGADGLVLIGPPGGEDADFSMRIFNADGSEAMMCGNASRCVGKYVYERGLTGKTAVRLATRSGVKTLRLAVEGGAVAGVTVDMLEPRFDSPAQYRPSACEGGPGRPVAGGREFAGTFVSMGNPHFVVFAGDVSDDDVRRYGPLLERHAAFPGRCNIEFARPLGGGRLRVRVWERGSGVTMACGTGACAVAAAAARAGLAGRRCEVEMDGGTLGVEWREDDGRVYLSGPAEFVFDGEIRI